MTATRLAAPPPRLAPEPEVLAVRTHAGPGLAGRLPALADFVTAGPHVALSRHPGWLPVLAEALGHVPYALEAVRGGKTVGYLGLSYVSSLLFGRFLVSLPYLNSGGVLAEDAAVAAALVDRAVALADQLGARYLELRHEWALEHPALGHRRSDKVHMRLDLPGAAGALWDQLDGKVRNQVRKGQKGGFTVRWGGPEMLEEFYAVFSQNMRDLGTPVYSRRLFEGVLRQFPDRAELCVARDGAKPAAAALLLHGWGGDRGAQRQRAAGVQPELCEHADVLASLGAGGAARAGRVRLRPLQRGRADSPLQEAVGGLREPGGVAVPPAPRHRRRHAAGQSPL